jgi:hypothetical protein
MPALPSLNHSNFDHTSLGTLPDADLPIRSYLAHGVNGVAPQQKTTRRVIGNRIDINTLPGPFD